MSSAGDGNRSAPGRDAIARFADDVNRAIDLRRTLFLREIDLDFEKQGGVVLYAIDSNVLNQYFRIHNDGQTSRRRTNAFELFEGPSGTETTDQEKNIGTIIAQYIFRALNKEGGSVNRPLLLLPGHDMEASNLYDQIAESFYTQVRRSQDAKRILREYLAELQKLPDQESQLEIAKQWEERIYSLLYGMTEPHERLNAYNTILSEHRLMKLERAAREPSLREFVNARGKPVFVDYESTLPLRINEGSGDWWANENIQGIEEPYLAQDKKALEALDKINRQLRPDRARVVLLTLNSPICRAGEGYFPFKYSDSEYGQYSFSDLYLRHPKCLSFEPAIMDPSQSHAAGDGSTAWLDAFLANIIGSDHSDIFSFRAHAKKFEGTRMRWLARRLLSRYPNQHAKLYKDWQQYVSTLALAHSSASSIAIKAMSRRMGKTDAKDLEVLEEFNSYITDLTERSWNDFFLTAAKSGYELIGLTPEAMALPRRKVPPLVLRGIAGSEKLISLINEPRGATINEERIIKLLGELGDDAEPRKAYVRTLTYALLFAYANRWAIAKLIAQRAIHIARRMDMQTGAGEGAGESFGRVTGREAYYFASVANRLTARSIDDLAESEDLIEIAAQKEHEEQERSKSIDQQSSAHDEMPTGPLPTGLRIRAEKIAIATSRLLFSWYQRRGTGSFAALTPETAKSIMVQIDRTLDTADECMDELVRTKVRTSLRDNYFVMLLVLEHSGELPDTKMELKLGHMLHDQLSDFNSRYRDRDGELCLSAIDIVSTSYASSLVPQFSHPLVEEIENKYTELDAHLMIRSGPGMMPYDQFCFETMRAFTARRR